MCPTRARLPCSAQGKVRRKGKRSSGKERPEDAAGPPSRVLYLMRPPVQLLLLLLPAQDGSQAAGAAPPTLCPRWLLH